jgi:hypothetical protein
VAGATTPVFVQVDALPDLNGGLLLDRLVDGLAES